ncbi:hypothetical protein VNO77_16202 [Canavalia gladiata]|uniref:Glycosyltransferases n=1 Tax=Canavalia gladiata TaxID=3824 RepID=A0AAN9M1B7_CANGL
MSNMEQCKSQTLLIDEHSSSKTNRIYIWPSNTGNDMDFNMISLCWRGSASCKGLPSAGRYPEFVQDSAREFMHDVVQKMGSLERSKRKVMLWKKAMMHFSLCFVMGFFTGFAPTGKSIFHSHIAASNKSEFAPQPIEVSHKTINVNRSWIAPTPETMPTRSIVHKRTTLHVKPGSQLKPRRLLIIVTPTGTKIPFQAVVLTRLANTIKLVPQPLLWIVVEKQTDTTEVSETLRKTGIMYRHLVSKENFTDVEAELNHQRNLALKHIVHHKLSGIVHFAELSNVYDLEFFKQLRYIEVFGTWPMALLAANRKKVIIEGPVCDSSQVMDWHLRNMNKETDSITPPIHISSFAFNSSVLWDPERWGRTSSLQDTSQHSINFVKQVVLEDEGKLKGIPPEDCSRILLWRFNFHGHAFSNHKSLITTSDVSLMTCPLVAAFACLLFDDENAKTDRFADFQMKNLNVVD